MYKKGSDLMINPHFNQFCTPLDGLFWPFQVDQINISMFNLKLKEPAWMWGVEKWKQETGYQALLLLAHAKV